MKVRFQVRIQYFPVESGIEWCRIMLDPDILLNCQGKTFSMMTQKLLVPQNVMTLFFYILLFSIALWHISVFFLCFLKKVLYCCVYSTLSKLIIVIEEKNKTKERGKIIEMFARVIEHDKEKKYNKKMCILNNL